MLFYTVRPRCNDPLYNELFGIMDEILCPSKGKMYFKEPQFNALAWHCYIKVSIVLTGPEACHRDHACIFVMMFSCFGFFNFYCYVGAYSTVYFHAVYFRASLQ